MPIRYALFENKLTAQPDDYRATVQSTGTAELEDVIERIIQRGSTVTRADIVSVLEDYFSAIESLVLEGMKVNTPSANYGVSIRGTFAGQADSYDPARHRLVGTVGPGKRYRRTIREQGQAVKQEASVPRPNPLEYVDTASGACNGTLTPGGMGRLVGHRLKFDPADPQQGVFLTARGGRVTRVSTVGKNKPGELIFVVPAGLEAGGYSLTVRAAFGRDSIRAGTLEATLTVP